MPTGIIINALSVVFGGIFGTLGGRYLSEDFKDQLNMIFGAASMTMAIIAIAPTKDMPVVIFAVIIGTAIGLVLHLGEWINRAGQAMQRFIRRFINVQAGMSETDFNATLLTIIVLFTASGTGIYGSLVNGMTGDPTILISKSILDFFTAAIFAANLGYVVSLIAVPQFIIFMVLYVFAQYIYPLTTPAMIIDFKAVGGILMLATGFRMIKVKMFPTGDMIPAMIISMPLTWLWVSVIQPLIAH